MAETGKKGKKVKKFEYLEKKEAFSLKCLPFEGCIELFIFRLFL